MMSIRVTQPGKTSLVLDNPVMNAAGTLGFGDSYRDLLDMDQLGAFVTNPITYSPRAPAHGTRVVPMDAGVLVHTGLPNPGINKVVSSYRGTWERMSIPVIAHVIVNNAQEVNRCVTLLENEEAIAAIELGLNDEMTAAEAQWHVQAARGRTEKPLLIRLPFGATADLAQAVIDAGGDSLVMCAAPRGTARDRTGRLVAGRVYSPSLKPLILRMVGQLARKVRVPVIAAGGIHSMQDARDYIEAGAVAVQVDSLTWVAPKVLEDIARDLGGLTATQAIDMIDDDSKP